MSRISQCLGALRAQGRKALIPFITCGDPSPEVTVELMHTLVRAGADILELGVPFSDPMADGPTIQRASERALANGMTLSGVLSRVAEFRKTDGKTPVVLMGYANPIEARGVERFVADARHAGVDGVLVVDYPPEECESFVDALRHAEIDPIFLLAPTSSQSRMEAVGRLASGYVYYVSIKGVTGAGSLNTAAVAEHLPAIRARVGVPVGVGFGIRDGASARAVAEVADAVVVGSRIIEEMEQAPAEHLTARVFELVRSLRIAIDDVGTPTAEVSE